MGELLAVTCDSCGEPMVPNVSTLDDDGCGWICLNPGCPELAAGELEAEDLVEAGVPEALAGRLARLIDHYVDAEEARAREADAPARARERAQADLARLHALLLELGRLAEGAGALAAHLNDALAVSYHSDDFAEAQEAKQALAAVGALCAVLRRIAADAQDWLAGSRCRATGALRYRRALTGAHCFAYPQRPPGVAVVILERVAGRQQSRHMSRPAHIVTLVAPHLACATATARYTWRNPPRRPGLPAPAGLLFGPAGESREWLRVATRGRLPGLPERLPPGSGSVLFP